MTAFERHMTELIESKMPEIGFILQEELKLKAPADTGRLRQSIKVVTTSNNELDVFMAEYWKFVEFGTNPHIIRPQGKALKFKTSSGTVFAKVVHHPGTRPNPFIRTTLFKLPKLLEGVLR